VRARFGPIAAGSGITGGLTNVCPKCGPGRVARSSAMLPVPAAAAAFTVSC
jgi:uncharacterized protein (DUF983 family)